MTGKFGTQKVLLSWCEWTDYSNIPFADETSFLDYFDQPWFYDSLDVEADDRNIERLMDLGYLGYTEAEVISS